MADITNVFKATVKTMKARNKKQGLNSGPDKSILGTKRNRSEFTTKAKDVVSNITKLKAFLMEHQKDYLNAGSPLGMEESDMTDAQRDQIDADAQTFMRTCAEAIKVVVNQAHTDHTLPQVKEHREAVCQLMDTYLKDVCKVFSEQRAIRVKRVVDKKRISRLEPEAKHLKRSESKKDERKKSADGEKIEADKVEDDDQEKSDVPKEKSSKEILSGGLDFEPPVVSMEEEEELSPEEMQMFEQENQQLYEEMNSLVDEVKNIEGKVVEISRLQEIFADKVLQQDGDIDRIADTVVGTTENIKEANEEIRTAMKNNAGLRVWILFFLIVLSFSLLFLDWYNP